MVPLPPLGNGEEIDPDNTNVAKPAGLTVRSEQFLQNVTNFKSRLRTMSQRQGELVRLIGILPQEGCGPVTPADGAARETPTFNQEPLNVSQNTRLPPILDPTDPQQVLPPLSQLQGPGQPPLYNIGQGGPSLTLPPINCQGPLFHLSHPIPVFCRFHNRVEHIVGFFHQDAIPHTESAVVGPRVRFMPSGPAQSQGYQPLAHPWMQQQMIPTVLPQVPPQTPFLNPMQMQGAMKMNRNISAGSSFSYPGNSMPGINKAGPSTIERPTARVPRKSATSRPRTSSANPNNNDGNRLDAPSVSGRKRKKSSHAKPNPTRKTRPTDLSESE